MKNLFDTKSPGRIHIHPDDLAEVQSELSGGGVPVNERTAMTKLPLSADAWELYSAGAAEKPPSYRVGLRAAVRALNAAVKAAAADPGLKVAIKAAKKAAKDSYGDFSRHRLEKSPEWKAVQSAQYVAFRTHIAPVLHKYSEYGAEDSEPYYMATALLGMLTLDALGVTDSFDRRWLRFE